ncbi:MAG: YggS family pyridoxal phosphate-dependent enzyme [Dehalococcoidia bacterium]|nr:YggS family pyridoxal phosphate-dependent enzyme [Dehalococcoidia bacterium]
MTAPASPGSTTDLPSRLAAVRGRIRAACERAGRDPTEVTLVGVSKTHPPAVARAAVAAGLADLGENRAQELAPKAEALTAEGVQPRWHFIGHLQRNKVRDVLPHIAALHSVASERLVDEVERRFERRDAPGPLPCYIEVNVAGETSKEGIPPSEVEVLLRRASASTALRVEGLMTVAPRVSRPEEVRPVFRALRELAAAHGLAGLSMGMTDDFEVAIEEGATVVRVGRAIFGERQ